MALAIDRGHLHIQALKGAMFSLHLSQQPGSVSLYAMLLQLSVYPDVVGITYFPLTVGSATAVLNLSLTDHVLFNCDPGEFWESALSLQGVLFNVISE